MSGIVILLSFMLFAKSQFACTSSTTPSLSNLRAPLLCLVLVSHRRNFLFVGLDSFWGCVALVSQLSILWKLFMKYTIVFHFVHHNVIFFNSSEFGVLWVGSESGPRIGLGPLHTPHPQGGRGLPATGRSSHASGPSHASDAAAHWARRGGRRLPVREVLIFHQATEPRGSAGWTCEVVGQSAEVRQVQSFICQNPQLAQIGHFPLQKEHDTERRRVRATPSPLPMPITDAPRCRPRVRPPGCLGPRAHPGRWGPSSSATLRFIGNGDRSLASSF